MRPLYFPCKRAATKVAAVGRGAPSCAVLVAGQILAMPVETGHAQQFLPVTPELCAGYAGQMVRNIQAVGLYGVSPQFKESNLAFLGPRRDCSGPARLVVVTPRDAGLLEATRHDVATATGAHIENGLLVGGVDIYLYIQIEDRRR